MQGYWLFRRPVIAGVPTFCRSWLASDAVNAVYLSDRGDAIASKPAPTGSRSVFTFAAFGLPAILGFPLIGGADAVGLL
jgi:hypothetical protein